MDFITSDYYFWFLPIVFLVTFTIGHKKRRNQILILLVSSYVFFWLASGWHILLLFVSTITDWTASKKIHNSDDSKYRKRWLRGALIINLGLLGLFKYLDFLIESLNWVSLKLASSPEIDTFGLLLPVGISFYTFQTMSYSLDIFNGKLKPTKDFISFASFVSFFPQLVAGPIERASNLLPQILNNRVFNYEQGVQGLRLILWGMFKKVVIADSLAPIVDNIFAGFLGFGGLELWLGMIYFSFQIYCDFSGYSDIAIGTAKLFGFDLMLNFRFPYFSRDIGEFWRRWHISLSTWFRDYLYIPMGGSRGSKFSSIRNIFIIFIISGFWHGANWTFLFWGFIHAILYLPLFLFNKNRKYLVDINYKNNVLKPRSCKSCSKACSRADFPTPGPAQKI